MNDCDRKGARGSSTERGLYIILIAFFLFVLVALCALVIGLGFLSTNKTRMQNIANVASIAALESFVQNRNAQGTPAPYDQRRNDAIRRANEILQLNRGLPGMGFTLGNLGLPPTGGDGGKLVFGMWYPERTSGDPCGSDPADYPCFRANSEPGTASSAANAVRIELKSQPNNPLILPFGKFLGQDSINVSTSSLARLVQRCVVFALDASMSTILETHVSTDYRIDDLPPTCIAPPHGNCTPAAQNTRYPTPAIVVLTPNPVSMFGYLTNHLNGFTVGSGFSQVMAPPVPTPNPCQNVNNYPWEEFVYYCNMPPNRAGATPAGASDTRHFRTDYRTSGSPYGTVAVDVFYESMNSYFGPQPLSRFFLAFNAGIRAVQQVRSQGDKAMVYVFQGDGIDSEPVKSGSTYQLAENMDMMVQLTNIMNRGAVNRLGNANGAYPVITPNFITRGWFPYASSSSSIVASTSNHAKALWDAIEALSSCPDSARRVIILATDGIPTCAFSRDHPTGNPAPDPLSDCVRPTVSAGVYAPDYYENYLAAEAAILGPIKQELIKRGISVTTLLDSAAIGPNYINATIPPGLTPTPSSIFVNPEDAAKYGFCGIPGASGSCTSFFNIAPTIGPDASLYSAWASNTAGCAYGSNPGTQCTEDQYAFKYSGVPQLGTRFRRPNALWGQLAMDTGGVICPLLNPCPSNWYLPGNPPALDPARRATMSEITCSPLNQTKAQQAINCVLAAVGIDPYQNVEELPTVVPAN